MEIQLKNVYFSERLSEETNAFTADVWFKGKKVGYAKNDGRGGCTFVQPYGLETKDMFREAEAYAKTLPEIVYEGRGGLKGFSMDSYLESQVDRLFENWLEKKEMQKNERKGIYYRKPNGRQETTYWKGWSIPQLLERADGRTLVKKAVNKLISEGCTILNTNLPPEILKKA